MLGLEPLLRSRLAEIPGFVAIYGAPAIDDPLLAAELPAAYVIWDGYKVIESGPNGRAARIASRWHVVVAVHNPQQQRDGAPARADAAPLVNAVLGKLMGWRASSLYSPLVLSDPGSITPTYRGGALRFPIAVTTEVVVKGD
jgi:hypothetical protein